MYNIAVQSENILRFITENVNQYDLAKIEDIYSNFPNESHQDVIACLEQLNSCGYIYYMHDDSYEVGKIRLLPNGRLYFKEQIVQNNNNAPTVNINNSSGFNVGNNNTVNFSENLSYEQIHELIDSSNQVQKEALHEFVNILKDCLENSKPLPKNKFSKVLDSVKDVTAFVSALGSLVLNFVGIL